jgi:hypothetical protein
MSAFDHEAIRAHVEMRHKLAVAAEMDGVLTVTIIELNLTGGTTVMASDGAAASATCSPGLAGIR